MTNKISNMTKKEINLMILALKIAFVGSASAGLLSLMLGDYQTAIYGIFIAISAFAGKRQLIKG